jgi:hypothetical protein
LVQEPNIIVIYPIFNFQASEELAEKIKNGFQFSNKVILRQIEKEEVDRFYKTFPYLWGDGAYLISLINLKTFVFEVKDEINRAERLVYEVLTSMRLHKPHGAVFCKLYRIEENSKTIESGCINPPAPWKPSTYQLSISEIEEVDEWIGKINKVNLDKNSSFRVACERFNRSYEERRDDDKIIDLAIAFEALFTGEDTTRLENMGKFVGLGCSMLLGQNAEDRKEISQFLEKAFHIRNGIVHNLKLETIVKVNGKEYRMKDFSIQLQKYLRDSIKKLL